MSRLLLQHGADMYVETSDGTPIELAEEWGDEEVLAPFIAKN
ncbi:hypothetical protein [Spirochaeta cellobiosiphila]|nr:hypothetical protein [Spirochaeta cellobiosiphila]